MHAAPTKPTSVRDFPPAPLVGPPPDGRPRRRRRALRPAVVATAAVVAVGLASTVGTLVVGRGTTRPVASSTTAVPPTAVPPTAVTARGAQAGIAAAEQSSAGPVSSAPTPNRVTPRVTPTGTGAVGGVAPPASAAALAPAPAQAARAAQPTGDATAETAVLTLVNQERAKANCPALNVDARLTAAARDHSTDMAGRGYFAHDTPDGVNVGTRVTTAGYRWSAVGENIAEGQQGAAAVMQAWMNSPGHRANILNCRFSNIGIGLAHQGGTPVWTQDFGTPLG